MKKQIVERSELRERAARLRKLGWGYKTVARELGISATTVRRWTKPGYAEESRRAVREAKRKRSGVCIDCGGATRYAGHGEPGGVSMRCRACHQAYEQSDERRAAITYWTCERVIDAIRRWAAEYGDPPAQPDWSPHRARQLNDFERARRFEEQKPGTWPGFMSVIYRFGSWNAGIAAAGFTPRAAGGNQSNSLRRRDQGRRIETA